MGDPPDIRPSAAATPAERFLALGLMAVEVIRASEPFWDLDSALDKYTVGALAGHLARAVVTVESYLDAEVPPEPPTIDAAGYFEAVLGEQDPVASDLHRQVRARSAQLAAGGPASLAERVSATLERLTAALAEPALRDRTIEVRDGIALKLDDYLETRLVELVIHIDDLAASGVGVPELPRDAIVRAAGVLGELAARRHGIDAVRSLARAERHPDAVRAL